MNDYEENRFGDFREKSLEELISIREDLLEDIQFMENAKNISSEQGTEFHNDVKFDREQIDYIDSLIQEKTKGRSR